MSVPDFPSNVDNICPSRQSYASAMHNADFTRDNTIRYLVNSEFTEATLFFRDGSSLQFVHKTRGERWARPSADETAAGHICAALRQFRLNAKHLQLFFEDGDDVEFFSARTEAPDTK